MLGQTPRQIGADPEDASLEHRRRPTARPDARRVPTLAPVPGLLRGSPVPSPARSPCRPGRKEHHCEKRSAAVVRSPRPSSPRPSLLVDRARRDQLGDAAARPRALPVRARPGRVGRQLHRPQLDQRRVRQVPDPAEQLGRLGAAPTSAARRLPQTPANQEIVAHRKVTALYVWLDSWPAVAHWWLTGSAERNPALWSSFSRTYVSRVMAIMKTGRDHGRPGRPSRSTSLDRRERHPGPGDRGRDRVPRPLVDGPVLGLRRPAGEVRHPHGRRRDDARSPARASPGSVPSGRPAARPGSTSTASTSPRSTSADRPSTPGSCCSRGPSRPAGRTRSGSPCPAAAGPSRSTSSSSAPDPRPQASRRPPRPTGAGVALSARGHHLDLDRGARGPARLTRTVARVGGSPGKYSR